MSRDPKYCHDLLLERAHRRPGRKWSPGPGPAHSGSTGPTDAGGGHFEVPESIDT